MVRWQRLTCTLAAIYACSATKGTLGGMFGMLKGLVGSKSLSRKDMESVLDKMRDHLIGECKAQLGSGLWGNDPELAAAAALAHLCFPLSSAKNVAADIALQLCESVASKLEGKVMGTFSSKYCGA